MLVTNYDIKCEDGLHARPASELTELAQTFACEIKIVNKENKMEADAKSIIEVLCLGAEKGMNIDLITDGVDEASAAEEIVTLLESIIN